MYMTDGLQILPWQEDKREGSQLFRASERKNPSSKQNRKQRTAHQPLG